MANNALKHPLYFQYVYITYLDDGLEYQRVHKVFYVDSVCVRLRSITIVDGKEVEGENFWIPWSAIRSLRAVNNGHS